LAIGALFVFGVIWSVVAAVSLAESSAPTRFASTVVPAAITLVSGSAAWYLITRNRFSLLTPLPLAFGLVALVYGFGPLLYVVEADSAYATAFLRVPVDLDGLFRVQILNLVGLTCFMVGLVVSGTFALRLAPRTVGAGTRRPPDDDISQNGVSSDTGFEPWRFDDRTLLRGYLCFTAIAFAMRSVHRLLGSNPFEVMPGFLHFTDGVGALAVFLGAILAARRGGLFWLLPVVPLAVEIIEGFLALRKSKILIPIVFAFLGIYLGGRSVRLLVAGILSCVVLFVVIYPVITGGRRVAWSGTGVSSTEYFVERLSGREVAPDDAIDVWVAWSRWNYTPVQYALMREYDANRPGNTFSELPWLFIPRFLAPSKPILDYGARVTEIVFGHRRSSSGPTIFGEAYWNGGWPLVVFSAFIAGVILHVMSLTGLWLFKQRSLLAWPVGFMGVFAGQVLQNFFTGALIGTAVTFFWLVLLVSILLKAMAVPSREDWRFAPLQAR
jgi:hypothetical protein